VLVKEEVVCACRARKGSGKMCVPRHMGKRGFSDRRAEMDCFFWYISLLLPSASLNLMLSAF